RQWWGRSGAARATWAKLTLQQFGHAYMKAMDKQVTVNTGADLPRLTEAYLEANRRRRLAAAQTRAAPAGATARPLGRQQFILGRPARPSHRRRPATDH